MDRVLKCCKCFCFNLPLRRCGFAGNLPAFSLLWATCQLCRSHKVYVFPSWTWSLFERQARSIASWPELIANTPCLAQQTGEGLRAQPTKVVACNGVDSSLSKRTHTSLRLKFTVSEAHCSPTWSSKIGLSGCMVLELVSCREAVNFQWDLHQIGAQFFSS